ncbi:MAG: TadE/TadG family type IV pilus assembly protein [Limnochordia bacterium]|jgi:hypothetical protein|nr:pilus assembly protein [Limnochordia bacterium]MDD2629111.1 TadE/TadG family type IV pilus assembly protein [Limnochordia bacterium]MDD4517287.1 TadE/TadG family type IV pilus assembly protein [Limnochordia bacterium]
MIDLSCDRGQVLLEAAIVLPLLLLVTTGIIYLAIVFNDGLVHRYITFDAVREAAVAGGVEFYAQNLYTAHSLLMFRGGAQLDFAVENNQVAGQGTLYRYLQFPVFLRKVPAALFRTKYRLTCSPRTN